MPLKVTNPANGATVATLPSDDAKSVRAKYERARAAGHGALPALPSLLIVCDEFTELISAQPDFVELFLQIGRIGRSIGVHLLLATQRFEEGRLRGLDSNLSYKIALRTFTGHESRAILDHVEPLQQRTLDRVRSAFRRGHFAS